MNQDQKKQLLKLGLPIILSTILLLGISYAWLTITLNGTKTNVLKSGTLSLVLDDTIGEGITIENSVPMYDTVGLTQVPYTFTLTNDGTVDSEYTLYLDDMDLLEGETRLPDGVIKYNLTRDDESLNTALLSSIGVNPDRVLDTGVIAPKTTYTYHLRLWLDENMTNEDMNKVFRGKIRVVATQVIEPEPTESGCFVYTKYGNAIRITDYKCYEGNPDGMPVITDVVIPRLIDGVEVKTIYGYGDTAFGLGAFKSKGLTSVVMPNSVTYIGPNAFNYNQLTSVVIPDGVTTIGNDAFYNNQLTSVKIPDGVTSIGADAFRSNQLTSITIPDGVTSIGSWAFSYNQLTSVTIPDGVTSIGDRAFSYNQLTSVTIPEGVNVINDGAFGVNKLTSAIIPSSVTSIGPDAFYSNALTSVTIKGKSSTADFTSYPTYSPFGWALGYNDSNITWQP